MTIDPSLMQIGTRNSSLHKFAKPLLRTTVRPNISHS
jgi:hypothetical protein